MSLTTHIPTVTRRREPTDDKWPGRLRVATVFFGAVGLWLALIAVVVL